MLDTFEAAARRPRWQSLKLGDAVIVPDGRVFVLVAEKRFKKRWSEHGRTHYWRRGTILSLPEGKTFETELDSVGVKGEVVRLLPGEGG